MTERVYSRDMGRVRDFLNQDAIKAIDRLVEPYVRFMLRHSLLNWLVFGLLVALIWVFVSRWLALLMLGLAALFLFYGLALALWRHRAAH
jgi:hypothetical protein